MFYIFLVLIWFNKAAHKGAALGLTGTTAVAIFTFTCGATGTIFAGANFTTAIWVSAIFFDFDWSALAL
jgi:hypothetical protein